MSAFLQLAFALSVILLAAKVAGYLSTRLGQPSVLGELLVGLLLGPSVIDLTHLAFVTDTHLGEIVAELGELGVLLLMFLAGLELNLGELAKNSRVSGLSGTLGVLMPVGLGLAFGELTGLDTSHAMFLGLTLGATSVSISAQVLIEMKKLRSRVGLGLLGAAVFDDILVILLLSTYLALQSGGSGLGEVLLVLGRMILYLGLAVALGLWVLPWLVRKTAQLPIGQGVVTLAVVVAMVYGITAEVVGGMAAITGAFVAGLMFARTPEKHEIEAGLRSLAYSFFVPVFFVSIGLAVDLGELQWSALWTTLAIVLIAMLGKILGAGLGARWGRFSWRESLQLGIGMVSRGEVGLIVAKVGLDQGLLSADLFSAIVGMVLVTTLVTPPLLRLAFAEPKKRTPPVPISESEVG
ncbi:MAG: cation:proton antiporter [Anaerolinea sp.]|nr:cation:proton antiporter [Anaerolinea sp.]